MCTRVALFVLSDLCIWNQKEILPNESKRLLQWWSIYVTYVSLSNPMLFLRALLKLHQRALTIISEGVMGRKDFFTGIIVCSFAQPLQSPAAHDCPTAPWPLSQQGVSLGCINYYVCINKYMWPWYDKTKEKKKLSKTVQRAVLTSKFYQVCFALGFFFFLPINATHKACNNR